MIGRLRSRLSASNLGVRLGSTLMLALMPLGVLSIVQARDAQDRVDASTLEGVGGAALQAVRSQINIINEAQVTVGVLAAVLGDELASGPACVDRVTAIARQIPQATLVSYTQRSGLMTCSSTGQVFDFKDNPRFQALMADPGPKIAYNPRGIVSGTAIISVTHPVFNRSGALDGLVNISLSYSAIAPQDYVDTLASWRPSYLATVLADGTVLLSSDPDTPTDRAVPASIDLTRLADLVDHPTFVEGETGRNILAVVGVTSDLYLLSIWQPEAGSFWQRATAFTPYLLPVLTWIAALAVAAFASSRLVVRHVRALSRSMATYVSTRQRLMVPDLSGAPAEIQRLHAAYDDLIRTIEQEEAELQNLLVDKDVLIREVNHRSGNSLQIIASVMRMYRREASDSKLRSVLDGLINRVIALSSTHTSLYALSGQRDVGMDIVLSNVVKRLKEIHGVALGVATKRLQPIKMGVQAAVPLALALAEAVGCYFSLPGLGPDAVTVELSEADGIIRLRIGGPVVPQLRPETTDGLLALPQRMMRQFAAQLFGTVSIHIEDERATVELVFPRPKDD